MVSRQASVADREARRHRDTEGRHLGEPDPLAAEQLAPAGGDLVECVDESHGADPTYSSRLRRGLQLALMRRVAIIASASGCGKSTVGRALATSLDVPYVELDAIHHQAGWTELDADELRRRVEPIVAGHAMGGRRLLPGQAR